MDLGYLIGLIGGALNSASVVAQWVHVWELRSAYEISTAFTAIMLSGCILWTAYGFYFSLLPVMVFSVLNTLQVAILLALKFRYGRQARTAVSEPVIDVR
jgi:uncharacterized protein with PQ loop repeat